MGALSHIPGPELDPVGKELKENAERRATWRHEIWEEYGRPKYLKFHGPNAEVLVTDSEATQYIHKNSDAVKCSIVCFILPSP